MKNGLLLILSDLDSAGRGKKRDKEGRGGRRDRAKGGMERKEGRGGRREEESKKMKKLLKTRLYTQHTSLLVGRKAKALHTDGRTDGCTDTRDFVVPYKAADQ